MEKDLLIGIIVIAVLLLILIFYRMYLKQQLLLSEIHSKNSFNDNEIILSVKNELKDFQSELVNNFKNDLNNLNQTTLQNLHNVSLQLNEGLNLNLEKTHSSFLQMSKHLVSVEKTQESLNSLSDDILALQNVLLDKKNRGIFGEVELYSILKGAYGLNSQMYQTQYKLSNNTIADAVLFAPSPLNKIVIDSKFPLENYLRMYDEESSKNKIKQAEKMFARDVKRHIDDIKNKYIIKGETSSIAFLFIPAEAIFAEINSRFLDVVAYSYDANVYLVSPSTLMAYISAIKSIYLGVKQNEKVDLMQQEFAKLATEFDRFEKRYQIIVNNFEKMSKDMRNVSISADKIIKRFYQIEAVQLQDEGESNVIA